MEKIDLHWHQDPISADIRRAIIDVLRLHGPIDDPDNHTRINSVVKRVYGVFKGFQKGVYDNVRATEFEKINRKDD